MSKISVIIPVHNGEKTIAKCLRSLLQQTDHDFDTIIINDNCTDKTLAICNKMIANNKKFTIINSHERGISNARNTGIRLAQTDYIMFADCDDYLDKTAIESVSNIVTKNTVDLLVFEYEVITRKQPAHTYSRNKVEHCNKEDFIKCILMEEKYGGVVWNKVFKKDLFKKTLFNEKYKIGEDLDLVLRYIRNTDKIYYTDKVLYYYVKNNSSITNSSICDNNNKWDTEIEMLLNLISEFRNTKYEIYAKRRLCRTCITLCKKMTAAQSKRYKKILRTLLIDILKSNKIPARFKINCLIHTWM